jgi:hypothetical protein
MSGKPELFRVARGFAVLAACASLSGCFFIWIPGSLIRAVSDGITGAKGQHCVASTVQVGDKITIPGVGLGTVKSLSGESMRCTNPIHPIRAELEF